MASTVSFHVNLGASEWASELKAWRCPVLRVPGASITEVFSNGEQLIENKHYIVDISNNLIKKIGETETTRLTVSVLLTTKLARASTTTLATAISALLGTVFTAIMGYYTAIAPTRRELDTCNRLAESRTSGVKQKYRTASQSLRMCMELREEYSCLTPANQLIEVCADAVEGD